ncbi:hypothetical protein K504DRAFT_501537 [Pleomassaria siparia CBS 279.74]|uniref:GPI anchored protein n=1 Tax=Pleomassaria siparia CBS 279.74 TaxID=1314801 RepID=A0A6G1KCK2_9PLEO|nr:hypothetical protein K504DRAFT_501537 [Pleomassaria siparia CBS 279.74]
MLFQTLLHTFYLLGIVLAVINGLKQEVESSHYRQLKAAKRHVDTLKRSDKIIAKSSIVLTYAEDTDYVEETTFASQVHLSGNRPTLFIEEFEHLLHLVECSASKMTLEMRDDVSFHNANDAFEYFHGGLVVASHSTCSDLNAHSVFDVLDIEFDQVNSRIILGVKETTWHDSFDTKRITFGHTSDTHTFYRHDRLSRRLTEIVSASGALKSAASTLIPTSTPSPTSLSIDLNHELENMTFPLPSGRPTLPPPGTIGCKKCGIKGTLVLSHGEFELVSGSELFTQFMDSDQDMDFVKRGFIKLELNGFEASVLLSVVPTTNVNFTYDLFTISTAGFQIPGIGAVGVLFRPQLLFDLAVSQNVEFTWGFKVSVPDKSGLLVDLGNFNGSGVEGFDDISIEALPFNTNVSDIKLSMQAGLRPTIPIGLKLFGEKLGLTGGPFLNLPFINTTIDQLATSDFNAKCEKGEGSASFTESFKNLTHITSDLNMGVGFEFKAIANLPGSLSDHEKSFNHSIWSKSSSLPTACLAFGEQTGLSVATDMESEIVSSGENKTDGGNDKPKSAASRLYTISSGFSAFLSAFGIFALTILVVAL